MVAKLFSKFGKMRGKAFTIDDEAVIGRTESNQIVLNHPCVSSRHARIYYRKSKRAYYLEDYDSLNGTKLDGVAVSGSERMGNLSLVTFGNQLEFIFQNMDPNTSVIVAEEESTGTGKQVIRTEADPTPEAEPEETFPGTPTASYGVVVPVPQLLRQKLEPEETPEAEAPGGESAGPSTEALVVQEPPPVLNGVWEDKPLKAPAKAKAPAVAQPAKIFYLLVLFPNGQRSRFPLKQGANVVGRGGSSDIHLETAGISRRHAVITLSGEQVTLRDEGSSNHTYLQNQMLKREVPVEPGNIIRFGPVKSRLKTKEIQPTKSQD